jgi:Tfp pilus assembly protein PilF
VRYLSADFAAAERAVATVVRLDPKCGRAHMITASIQFQKKNMKACQQALDQASALDFAVMRSLPYAIMQAQLLESQVCL